MYWALRLVVLCTILDISGRHGTVCKSGVHKKWYFGSGTGWEEGPGGVSGGYSQAFRVIDSTYHTS